MIKRNTIGSTKSDDHRILIKPWSQVRESIATFLNAKLGAVKREPSTSNLAKSPSQSQIIESSSDDVSDDTSDDDEAYDDSSNGGEIEKDGSESTQNKKLTEVASISLTSNAVLSVTLPYGFQMMRSLPHTKASVKSVLFVSDISRVDSFVSVDTRCCHVWRGSTRLKRLPITKRSRTQTQSVKTNDSAMHKEMSVEAGGLGMAGLMAMTRWAWVGKFNVFILANAHLELKVLDSSLNELSVIRSPKPVLHIQFIESCDEVVAAGVGNISIYSLKKSISTVRNRTIYVLGEPRMVISDLKLDDWVSFTTYDRLSDRLLVASDANVFIYNLQSGKRLHSMNNIHELSITALAYYAPSQYIITASKDASIKIWNSNFFLLHQLSGHSAPVTGMILFLSNGMSAKSAEETKVNDSNADDNGDSNEFRQRHSKASTKAVVKGGESGDALHNDTVTLLSCSLDRTMQLWNLESGQCLYRMETQHPCLGIEYMRRDTFYHFTCGGIYVWNLNRFFSPFNSFQSQVRLIKHILSTPPPPFPLPQSTAKIVAVGEDCSIRIINPVTAETVTTTLPTLGDAFILDVLVDPVQSVLYTFLSDGRVAVQTFSTNPCQWVDTWNLSDQCPDNKGEYSAITCVTSLHLIHLPDYGDLIQDVAANLLQHQSTLATSKSQSTEHTLCFKDFWLLAATSAGQLVALDTQDHGAWVPLVQAHAAEITAITATSNQQFIFTAARDHLVKQWRVVPSLKKKTNSQCFVYELILTATCVRTIPLPNSNFNLETFFLTCTPTSLHVVQSSKSGASGDFFTESLLFPIDTLDIPATNLECPPLASTKALLDSLSSGAEYLKHTHDEEHTKPLSAVASLSTLHIFATASFDGTVKLWDSNDHTLIREIQFSEPIRSVAFANLRGDLLVGVGAGISLVRMQDHLSLTKLHLACQHDFIDDTPETSIPFDSSLEFYLESASGISRGARRINMETSIPSPLLPQHTIGPRFGSPNGNFSIWSEHALVMQQATALPIHQLYSHGWSQYLLFLQHYQSTTSKSNDDVQQLIRVLTASQGISNEPLHSLDEIAKGNHLPSPSLDFLDRNDARGENNSSTDESDSTRDTVDAPLVIEARKSRRPKNSPSDQNSFVSAGETMAKNLTIASPSRLAKHVKTNSRSPSKVASSLCRESVGGTPFDSKTDLDDSVQKPSSPSSSVLLLGEHPSTLTGTRVPLSTPRTISTKLQSQPSPNSLASKSKPFAASRMLAIKERLQKLGIALESKQKPPTTDTSPKGTKSGVDASDHRVSMESNIQSTLHEKPLEIPPDAASIKSIVVARSPSNFKALKVSPVKTPAMKSGTSVKKKSVRKATAVSIKHPTLPELAIPSIEGLPRVDVLREDSAETMDDDDIDSYQPSENNDHSDQNCGLNDLDADTASVDETFVAQDLIRASMSGNFSIKSSRSEVSISQVFGSRRASSGRSGRRSFSGADDKPKLSPSTEFSSTDSDDAQPNEALDSAGSRVMTGHLVVGNSHPELNVTAADLEVTRPVELLQSAVKMGLLADYPVKGLNTLTRLSDLNSASRISSQSSILSVSQPSKPKDSPTPMRRVSKLKDDSITKKSAKHSKPADGGRGSGAISLHASSSIPTAAQKPVNSKKMAFSTTSPASFVGSSNKLDETTPLPKSIHNNPLKSTALHESKSSHASLAPSSHRSSIEASNLSLAKTVHSRENVAEEEAESDTPLNSVLSALWFPGLGKLEPNLESIVHVVHEVLSKGLWSEKCEAAKALLLIHRSFQQDFSNVYETFIQPQLEHLWDPSWQVRAQLCSLLPEYKVHNREVVTTLICRLSDANEAVRFTCSYFSC